MRLLSYKLNVPSAVGTMDKYFHLMFRRAFPFVDAQGNITDDKMPVARIHLMLGLERLTKEHPVSWQLTVKSSRGIYEYTAQDGKVEYRRVGPNQNDSS